MQLRLLFILFVSGYLFLLQPFSLYMQQRPVAVKLGYTPHPQILKISAADHNLVVAEAMLLNVLFYYGTLIENFQENIIVRPEYLNMYQTLQAASILDPYNQDNYYFAQAAFTWELGRVEEVNALLKRGTESRTWDPWLPFYIGFNYAYFLKDYQSAAPYMKMAAERSGNPLFTRLAARYFYESENTDLGLLFLNTMIDQAKDKTVKLTYTIRRDALVAIKRIESAVEKFKAEFGVMPETIAVLVAKGYLDEAPVDPYGGEFYFDEAGRTRTTSKLAAPDM